jgi:hypothetical protein
VFLQTLSGVNSPRTESLLVEQVKLVLMPTLFAFAAFSPIWLLWPRAVPVVGLISLELADIADRLHFVHRLDKQ